LWLRIVIQNHVVNNLIFYDFGDLLVSDYLSMKKEVFWFENCRIFIFSIKFVGVSLSPGSSPSTEAPGVTTPSSTEPAAGPNGKSAASALLPISTGSLLLCLLSVFSGLY
jgi:hypothetical protein